MLRGLVSGFLDLVYPRRCAACKTQLTNTASIDDLVCTACWAKIKKNPPPFCHSCGRHLQPKTAHKNICGECSRHKAAFDRAFSPCRYEGVIKDLICAFKYGQRDYLGGLLSRHMVDFIKEHRLPIDYIDCVIPVPLSGARLREREFNQALILGRDVASQFGKPLVNGVLVRSRHTKSQTELPQTQRLANVQRSFAVKNSHSVNGKNILLIDDVLTTGATVSEAAWALKAAGARIVFVLTLAS